MVKHFHNRAAAVAVGLFNAEQCSHSWRDVRHVCDPVGFAVWDAPPHPHQGDVFIVGRPSAVSRTPRTWRTAIPLRVKDNLDTSAAPGVISVGNPFANAARYAGRTCFFHIYYERNTFHRA